MNTQTQTIKAYTKNVYGQKLIYVFDKEQAQAIEVLTQKKTIDKNDIQAFKKLNVDIEVVDAFDIVSNYKLKV